MSNECLGECAPNRDTSYFNLLDSIRTLHDLPRFNLDTWLDDLTPMERQVIAGLYISKIADLLMGYKDDRETETEKVLNRIEELFAGDNDSSGNG